MNYPDGLDLDMINRNAQIDHYWRWQMLLDRGPNLMMLYGWFIEVQRKIILT
jgi:hypothetical protein